jgi:hypothetical protein
MVILYSERLSFCDARVGLILLGFSMQNNLKVFLACYVVDSKTTLEVPHLLITLFALVIQNYVVCL